MKPVRRGLLKSIPTMLILSACVAIAGRLEALGLGGVIGTLATVMVLVLLAAVVWAMLVPWSKVEFLVSLCPVPVVVLLVVAHYSGFTGSELFNSFNLAYVAQICLVLGLPWLAGTVLGSYFAKRSSA